MDEKRSFMQSLSDERIESSREVNSCSGDKVDFVWSLASQQLKSCLALPSEGVLFSSCLYSIFFFSSSIYLCCFYAPFPNLKRTEVLLPLPLGDALNNRDFANNRFGSTRGLKPKLRSFAIVSSSSRISAAGSRIAAFTRPMITSFASEKIARLEASSLTTSSAAPCRSRGSCHKSRSSSNRMRLLLPSRTYAYLPHHFHFEFSLSRHVSASLSFSSFVPEVLLQFLFRTHFL